MKRYLFALLCAFILPHEGVMAQPTGNFPHVAIPSYIAVESAAAEWLALHWWDAYDFSQTQKRYAPEANKMGFIGFIHQLYATSPECAEKSIEEMMRRASSDVEGYWYFLEMAEVVLYDASSPMRNDLLWEMFLNHATSSRSPLDEDSKVRYQSLLQLVSRNQEGSLATDFTYTLPNGKQGRLYDIRAPFTLLWFYNPGCSECARAKAQIEATGYLEILHERGIIEVLALYPDGDVAEWRKWLHENPKWWISAYDKGKTIDRNGLYDLKAIPTFYLLNGEKRVMMKDPVIDDLIGVLRNIIEN